MDSYFNNQDTDFECDGNAFFDDCSALKIHNPPSDSVPDQEPYKYGSPLFTHYTQVNFSGFISYKTDAYISLNALESSLRLSNGNIYGMYSVDDFMRILIGKNGMHLKYIQYYTNIHYIWNKTKDSSILDSNLNNKIVNGIFEIWGRRECLYFATVMLSNHISNVIRLMAYKTDYYQGKVYPVLTFPAPMIYI